MRDSQNMATVARVAPIVIGSLAPNRATTFEQTPANTMKLRTKGR
jgi:hypothetical protein